MRFLSLILIVFVTAMSLEAQTVISVNESVSRNTGKNLGIAMGASALLPGMGQYYLGEKSYVRAYVWSDVAFWTLTFGSYLFGEKQISNAQSYASRYAGVVNPSRDMNFLNTMGEYRSRAGVAGQNSNPDMNEDYNQAMLRSGQAIDEDYPMDASHTWDWGSSDNPSSTSHMNYYNDILRNYRVSRIVFQISVGALILNRVVAVLDVMRVYRATSSTEFSALKNVHLLPQFFPDGSGASVLYTF